LFKEEKNMIDLVPRIPAHPKAPKASRPTKGVGKDMIGKIVPKNNYFDYSHKRFRATHKECKLKDSELSAILIAFNENIMQAAIDSRSGVTLPSRMGKLQVVSLKSGERKKVKIITSDQLGVTVHEKKTKGGGMYPLIFLDVTSDSYNMPNKYLWEFSAPSRHKKTVWELFGKERTRFAPIKKDRAMAWRKDKFYKKEFAMKQSAELLLTYN
jgi:hypothetical protein